MKKNLIKTLLIGATIGTTLTGLTSNHADACRLTRYVTLAETTNPERVEMIIPEGSGVLYKKYKSLDYCWNFYDYDDKLDGHVNLYCKDSYGNPKKGLLKNGSQYFYFNGEGKAISGNIFIDGHTWCFDKDTYQGHRID